MDFAGPVGDPGWFGPGSAVWHVHSHVQALIFGLQCAAFIERLDPSIYWMGVHHSRLVKPKTKTNPMPELDPKGLGERLGHSVAFFTGTAYGSTPTAERLALAVRSMHHTIKGTRPDGARYDADDPEWLRWNYATVVWGIATAHELYHPQPLRGKDLDRLLRRVRAGGPRPRRHRPTCHQARDAGLSEVLSAEACRHLRRSDGDRPESPDAAGRAQLGSARHHADLGQGMIQHRDPNILDARPAGPRCGR